MLPYIFTENVQADIIEHALKYEEEQEGLGFRFGNEVEKAAQEIATLPKGYAGYDKSTRERRTKSFPFKLIYTVEKEIIYIHAVFPSRANPKNKYSLIKK
jgi:hypothetical protein